MNTHSSKPIGGEPLDRPLTRRAQAKLQTHERVLQAAKGLFIERGYEAATIRDIAQAAGMSTGAVFANFADKGDLFRAVIRADGEAQLETARALLDHAGPVDATLRELFSIGYSRQLTQLPLLQAATGLSWAEGMEGDLGERPQGAKVIALVRDVLTRAVARGELSKGADLKLLAEMLWDAYASNYRRAVFDHWDIDALNGRLAQQIDIILAGAKA